jgi:hypothetical protein
VTEEETEGRIKLPGVIHNPQYSLGDVRMMTGRIYDAPDVACTWGDKEV